MNSLNILEAINDIDNRFIVSAQKRLGYDGNNICEDTHSKKRLTFKRTALLVVAAALIIAACFTTALAVSPDFREKMFSFFRIEQEQIIPQTQFDKESFTQDMFVEKKITIDGIVQGKYIHTPVATHASDGVYLVCTDEVEMKQGSRYDAYYEQNGEFIKLEEYRFKKDYVLFDRNIHVEFDWAEYNGNVHITWAEANTDFQIPNKSGGASSVMLRFNINVKNKEGNYTETLYPVLINLHTGELTDVLAGTGAEVMEGIVNSFISQDRTKMLLAQNRENGCFLYYVDLVSKKVYGLDDLSGEHADACSLIGNTLACWSLRDGRCKAWNINLDTLKRKELFDTALSTAESSEPGIVFISGFDSTQHWEYAYSGSSFALETDSQQNVYAIDLLTGEKTPIEGYTMTKNVRYTPNSDGTKLLLTDGPDGQDIEYIGMLDYKNKSFVELERNNLNNVNEYLTYWFDNDTVIVSSYSDFSKDYYLYNPTVK